MNTKLTLWCSMALIMFSATNLNAQRSKTLIGKDKGLSAWQVPQNNIWWTIDQGVLQAQSDPKQQGSILWTKKKYKNFEVSFQFLMGEGNVDSGIFLRTEKQQIQLGVSGSLKRDMTGSIYVPGKGYPQEAENVATLLKDKDWNAMRIKVVGNIYEVWLNHQKVMTYKASKAIDKGPVGLQLHKKRNMSISFKEMQITKLKN